MATRTVPTITPIDKGYHFYWKKEDLEAVWRGNYFGFYCHFSKTWGSTPLYYHDFSDHSPGNIIKRQKWIDLMGTTFPSLDWVLVFDDLRLFADLFKLLNPDVEMQSWDALIEDVVLRESNENKSQQ